MSARGGFVPDPSWPSIIELATELWGQPNKARSTKDDVRFGSNGSKSVKPKLMVWKDHESGDGGGYHGMWKLARRGAPLPPRRDRPGPTPGNGKGEGDRRKPWENVSVVYPYHNAAGDLILEVIRTLDGNPRFVQRAPDGFRDNGEPKWKWSVKHIHNHDCLLYRLPGLRASGDATVWICEGEKDVDNLTNELLIATTCIGGAGKWRDEYADEFRGKPVVVLQDNDQAGRDHANMVARSLLGIAASLKVLLLPGLPAKGDVSDWLDAGGTAEELERLAREAPEYQTVDQEESLSTIAPALGIWDAGNDDYVIPPREWLLGNVFCKKFLSSLLADGGVGKTALRTAQILSLVTGRSLIGQHVFRRCRCLIVSLEDNRDELRRRVYAMMLKYGIATADVRGWLFLAAPKGVKLAKMVEGSPEAGALETLLREAIAALQLDLVCLDPFIKTHSMGENDNNAMDFVCDLLATIAIELNCAIDFPHHTNKGISIPGDANRGRGASSTKDAARLVDTLTPMSPDEGALFGVSEAERRSLVRLDSAKVNITPPSTEAKWFRLIGQALGNRTPEYPHGDNVQTVEPWQPPDTWADLDTPLLNRILDMIDAGMPNGQRYSDASRAGKRAAWRVIQEHVPEKPEGPCRAIIRAWVNSGTLFVEEYDDPVDRKPRIGLKVNHTKRPT